MSGVEAYKIEEGGFSFQTYWGEVKNNKPHRKGILRDMGSKGWLTPYYIGKFKNGLYHGKGNLYQYQSKQYALKDLDTVEAQDFWLKSGLVVSYLDTTEVETYLHYSGEWEKGKQK